MHVRETCVAEGDFQTEHGREYLWQTRKREIRIKIKENLWALEQLLDHRVSRAANKAGKTRLSKTRVAIRKAPSQAVKVEASRELDNVNQATARATSAARAINGATSAMKDQGNVGKEDEKKTKTSSYLAP